jgi:hypothetical protein
MANKLGVASAYSLLACVLSFITTGCQVSPSSWDLWYITELSVLTYSTPLASLKQERILTPSGPPKGSKKSCAERKTGQMSNRNSFSEFFMIDGFIAQAVSPSSNFI